MRHRKKRKRKEKKWMQILRKRNDFCCSRTFDKFGREVKLYFSVFLQETLIGLETISKLLLS